MRHTARLWTTSIAAAALVALPMIAAAQVYPPSSGQTTSEQSNPSSQSKQSMDPQYHLDQAKQVLDSISTADLTGEASTRISDIKTKFDELYNNYKSKPGSASSGAMSGQMGTSGSMPPSSSTAADWKTNFTKIESDLDALNIPKSSYAPPTGVSGTGTVSGTSGMSAANVNLPSDVRDKLEQFRMHLEQFYSLARRKR